MHDILNSLPDQIALLDKTATITETNRSWDTKQPDTVGLNFLQVYERMATNSNIKNIRLAVQKIIIGDQHEFSCLLENGEQRFSMQVTPVLLKNVRSVMVSFRDITDIDNKKTSNEEQLQVEQLTETNIALNTLLKSREQDRQIQEGAIVTNVKQLIMPYLDRLEAGELAPQQKTLTTIIRQYLDNLVSPFLHRMTTINQQLTPQELKVASLIRQGRSSKEIGEALELTVNGVGFHRKSIRTKLGLTGSGKNLRSQLMALR